MLRAPLHWLWGKLGRRYPRIALAVQFNASVFVVLGGVVLLDLFVSMSTRQWVELLLVAEALALVEIIIGLRLVYRLVRPADPWLRGDRTPETATAAWQALAGLSLDFIRYRRAAAVGVSVLPVSGVATAILHERFWPAFPILCAGSSIVLLYGVLLRFAGTETLMRPVLEEIAPQVPEGTYLEKRTIPLKWRLLVALPAINIVSGVVVSGLSNSHRSLTGLGFGVVVAIGVAFTISLELSVLLTRSIISPIRQLRRGTAAVAAGDFTARVPVITDDEIGQLTSSFNTMVSGLEERERLREAFGAFVDPSLAERVLIEGTALEGEEVEVTVLFLDIRDFTAFAERSTAREVVGLLNGFYELVVPVIQRHGGHANKFVGDGLLAVFGAPGRLEEHADHALDAALEIIRCVRARYHGELRIGIGVNSGPVVAGTIGGGGRVEFTVIGDAVNTASRVEAVTRDTGDDILVTAATCALLTREYGGFLERPTVELKGKTEEVRIYAPLVAAAVTAPAPMRQGHLT